MASDDDDFDFEKFQGRLGKRIAKIRKSKGYSQDRLSLEAGLSRGTMSKIESGTVDPLASTIARIAETLEVRIDKLFDN